MLSTVLSRTQAIWLPITAMLLFLSVFLGCLLWAFRRGSTSAYETLSQLPFKDLDVPGGHAHD